MLKYQGMWWSVVSHGEIGCTRNGWNSEDWQVEGRKVGPWFTPPKGERVGVVLSGPSLSSNQLAKVCALIVTKSLVGRDLVALRPKNTTSSGVENQQA